LEVVLVSKDSGGGYIGQAGGELFVELFPVYLSVIMIGGGWGLRDFEIEGTEYRHMICFWCSEFWCCVTFDEEIDGMVRAEDVVWASPIA